MATVGEVPELVHNLFTTPEDNLAGVYGLQFYIRGKPWVVDVDDALVWDTWYARCGMPAGLVYATPFDHNGDMWGAILEKAWGKVKGSIAVSGAGGYVATGLRSLVGAPYYMYYADESDLDDIFQLIQDADAANFLMGAGTDGGGNDQESNGCGIAKSHAYSLITAFTMTDSSNTSHDMLMFRNPWGTTTYGGQWAWHDPNWTDELVAQVPYGLDPRTEGPADGIFVMPKENIIWDSGCIMDVGVAHYRDGEGYTDDWFDATDMDEDTHLYTFSVPTSAQPSTDGPFPDALYVTIESYYSEVIPMSCFDEASGGQSWHPTYV